MQSNSSWFSKPQTQSLLAFFSSTCIHLVFCLALAFILISTPGDIGKSMQLAIASKDDASEVSQLDFTLDATASIPWVPVDPTIALSAVSADISPALAPVTTSFSRGEIHSSVAAQVAEAASTGETNEGATQKSKSQASFFGAQAEGNRFVFVIDSSGSMRGPRWEALCKELIRAIQSLSPDQDFFVISFDSTAHPMFGIAPPKGKFLKAVKKNVDQLRNWIRSIEHGRQTFPASAVGIAMRLEPDAIFLLSDGEINDSTVEDLRIWNRKLDADGDAKTLIPIHTVLLHSQMGYATLEIIAKENGGTFTPVRPR